MQPAGVGGKVEAYDPETGEHVFSLPPGITSADGISHLVAEPRGRDTVVSSYRVADSTTASWMVVPGRWQLAGVSPNGRFAALARQPADKRRTDVVVVNMAARRVAHRLELRGDFEVETVSRDGKRLFLIEHLPGSGPPRYLVRLFDLSHDRLASKPLRGKGEPSVMAGLAWSGVGSPDGRWLLTLYLNTGRKLAFVHALDLVRSSPLCIFLPSNGASGALKRYGLTLSPDGRRLYATNAALGGSRPRSTLRRGRSSAPHALPRHGSSTALARSPERSRATGARSTSARDGTSGPTTPPTGSCEARTGPAERSPASGSPSATAASTRCAQTAACSPSTRRRAKRIA